MYLIFLKLIKKIVLNEKQVIIIYVLKN